MEIWFRTGVRLPSSPPRRGKVRFAPTLFYAYGIKKRHPPAPWPLLFQNRSRSLRLFACKRALDASRSLPTCFGYGSSIPAGGIFQISFFNEIRLLVSEILLRNMKYAMRMKYLLRKGSSSYCKLTKIFLL